MLILSPSTKDTMRSVFFLGFMVFHFCISCSRAQTCRNYTFSNKNTYASCVDLPVLSSYLHWNYTPSTGTADVAFRRTGATTSRWISWAINPKGQRMVGCQALVAYMTSSGSMYAYTSSISSYNTDMPEGALSFGVPSISATYETGEMTIFARLELGTSMASVSQVWQEGPMNGPGTPGRHSTGGANMKSTGTLNFFSTGSGDGGGSSSGSSGIGSGERRKNVHGVLNAVSWGVLMPMGVLLARYLKVFKSANPAWFYLHVTCQTSAYAVGVAGWVTGLRLGDGGGGNAGTHGNIGMALFILGTLQVSFADFDSPQKRSSLYAYTSSISSYNTDMPEGALSFGVPSISATYETGEMTIFARLELGTSMASVSQVWQEGPMNGPGTPGRHSTGGANMKSTGTLNFFSTGSGDGGGSSSGSSGIGSGERRKNVHGVLNAVSWGVLMPMGVLLARYLKVFKSANPAWFYLHVTCQTSAYAVGVAGWVTGLRLGDGGGGNAGTHGNIGMALFILGTLQVFALLLRPKPDHKYRFYWNMYHHSCGYAAITLSIVNVFLGLDILDPTKVWKRTYIVILLALGCAALIMEPVTWAVVIKRRRREISQKHPTIVLNGARGNGYNGRSQDDGV
ncbi:cytochrome b561 and DOMON domain-containing protein At5g35735-like [Rhodamnia argentea]|uniref:Cytochrome b561 and DOMON domain-containing protein At5g35735-like n=1 Tax=Rhodamnia argentea TaxID=178133 RepID=A0ABM3HMS3_9MYRT|nr:cytochrome b561 and DOMON domain-containing protein At5g35735-like [Rhodamnia argentea]